MNNDIVAPSCPRCSSLKLKAGDTAYADLYCYDCGMKFDPRKAIPMVIGERLLFDPKFETVNNEVRANASKHI